MSWVEKELLSFRKECQNANLLGFQAIEDFWGSSCSVVALHAIEYCLFVSVLRFRACLPVHHLHDLESSGEEWGRTCTTSDGVDESYS